MSTDMTNEKGMPQSRTYTVNDIAAILGIGRATAYKLANSGLFKTIRIGRSRQDLCAKLFAGSG